MTLATMRTLQTGDDWIEEKEGGLARYYFELLRHLPATGTTAHGLVVGSPRIAESTGGTVVAFARPDAPILERLRSARKAALAQIDRGQIDLIAAHFALYALPIADRLRKVPTVVHFHGPWAGESGAEGAAKLNARFKQAVENVVYSRAKRFIVLSRSFQQELVRRYGVAEELIRVVPGGIDIERFNMTLSRAEARQRLGWPNDRPILLSIRRQVRRMGLEDLIHAAKLLVQQQPDLLLLLGGSGSISGELKSLIAELGLEDSVRLLGRIDDADLPTAYRAADMTIVPSQSLEGFGLITLESLAAGTPVYVTPVGGLPEIVQPFAPECVFSGTSSVEIASVLGEALRGARPVPTEDACRAYAANGYSWPHIAERVRHVYDEAMG
ncbi:glycosyltransferase family 4 protein [Granulicella mallensis]|uniref:Glycosyltransferase involved in cell wall biosynthesis n=1 Tax=Granulicella mallensis TaxID=940614 RepID=A0A7W7ZM20_9BACT|nr:glycosyltransferase family 4 protein [Granulicella mallensis]MBB5062421.1 glycosyltransferase involved in cell wall biosynthesis [Granulicella mallensis]